MPPLSNTHKLRGYLASLPNLIKNFWDTKKPTLLRAELNTLVPKDST